MEPGRGVVYASVGREAVGCEGVIEGAGARGFFARLFVVGPNAHVEGCGVAEHPGVVTAEVLLGEGAG